MDVSCLCDCPTCYRLSNFPFSNREVSFRSCFMALHLKTEGDEGGLPCSLNIPTPIVSYAWPSCDSFEAKIHVTCHIQPSITLH